MGICPRPALGVFGSNCAYFAKISGRKADYRVLFRGRDGRFDPKDGPEAITKSRTAANFGIQNGHNRNLLGDVAQLVRANGSYPLGQQFKSVRRYHSSPWYPEFQLGFSKDQICEARDLSRQFSFFKFEHRLEIWPHWQNKCPKFPEQLTPLPPKGRGGTEIFTRPVLVQSFRARDQSNQN